jgi:hypothetical protein
MFGDININYLTENYMKKQLDARLISYNLYSKVHFPTRIQKKSSTAIDDISIDTLQFKNYIITPMINGLSDHDAQLLTINEIHLRNQTCHIKTIRNINKNLIIDFQINLSYESWDNVLPVIMIRTLILCLINFLIPTCEYFIIVFPSKN